MKEFVLLALLSIYAIGGFVYGVAGAIRTKRELGWFEAITTIPLMFMLCGMLWPICVWPLSDTKRDRGEG